VVGDQVLRFVGRWPADDTAASTDFEAAVAATFVLPRRLEGAGAEYPIDASDEALDTNRPSPEPDAWLALRAAWATGAGTAAVVTHVARWSPHELLVAAALVGSGTFPTIDSTPLAASTQPSIDAVVDAVLASLSTRGLTETVGDGRRRPAGSLAAVVDMALTPDLVLWIERLGDGDSYGWWIGLRPDAAMQLTVLPEGGRESAWFDPATLVDHVLSLIAGAPGLTSVTALWHHGEVLHGGTFAWKVNDDGATSLAVEATWGDADTHEWAFELATTDALRDCLLGYLPGD
jgi:hypothetical protein